MTLQIVTCGELTVDDVIFEDGDTHWKQIGGGALYSAIGVLAWGVSPAINATIGADYPTKHLERLAASGIDVDDLTRIEAPSLGLWLLYERGGHRHQVQKVSGSTFEVLDAARDDGRLVIADGVHLAPQSVQGHIRSLETVRDTGATVTHDLLIEPFIDVAAYRNGEAIAGATAFLPSDQEIQQVWGDMAPEELLTRLRESAGIEHLVVKRGEAGADAVNETGAVRVPVVPVETVDPTGAGDAFSGGFLVGLLRTSDPVEAVIHGTVSASFVVETRGSLDALAGLDAGLASRRAQDLRAAMVGGR